MICLSAMDVITAPLFLQMPATLQKIGMFLRAHLIVVSLTTLGAVILALLNTSDELIRRVKWLGPAFDKCEQWLLSVGLNS